MYQEPQLDRTTYQVLETLQSLRGTDSDLNDGRFLASLVAATLGTNVAEVRDEFDLLEHAELIELSHSISGGRLTDFARVSTRGNAMLAMARKQRRLADSQGALSSVGRDDNTQLVVTTRSNEYAYDVFLSYASEDREFVEGLRDRLVAAGVSVWYDQQRITVGTSIVKAIESGVAASRHAIIVLSDEYLRKAYTGMEFDAFLKLQIERRDNIILPIRRKGVAQEDIERYSITLAGLRNINGDSISLDALADELLRVLKPPIVEVTTPPKSGGAPSNELQMFSDERPPGAPYDALPDDLRLFAFRPRLNIVVGQVQEYPPIESRISYVINNVGTGAASKIRAFIPGLIVDSVDRPIPANESFNRQIRYDDKSAYHQYMGLLAQVIVEFEDVAGNLYRQYGKPLQPLLEGGKFGYEIGELERPYLVPQRIVQEDSRRFSR